MSKPNQKRRLPSLARLRQAARRYRSGSIDALRKSMVSLSLSDYERKGLEKLAHRNSTIVGVELHRAIDAYLQSSGQTLRLLNGLIVRFHASLERNSQLLKEELRKIRNIRVSYARKPRQPRSAARKRR